MSDREEVLARLDVSRETSARLTALAGTLEKWAARINLVSRATLDQLWVRHIEDSAQLFGLAPAKARSWIDLGSGGGFPGLVIAALAGEKAPQLAVTLVESDVRKCAFLAAAAREMGVAPTILNRRLEDVPAQPFDVISARALASLDQLLTMSEKFAHPGTVRLFPKGAQVASELTRARARWHIDLRSHPSVTDPDAVILEIQEVSRGPDSRT